MMTYYTGARALELLRELCGYPTFVTTHMTVPYKDERHGYLSVLVGLGLASSVHDDASELQETFAPTMYGIRLIHALEWKY